MPKSLYAASWPARSRTACGSLNCFITNSRTCAFECISIFGGDLNLRPIAFSIMGTACATSAAYGPSYCCFGRSHPEASENRPAPASATPRIICTLISKPREAQIPRDDRVAEKQSDQRSRRKKDAEWQLPSSPSSRRLESKLGLSLVVGDAARR